MPKYPAVETALIIKFFEEKGFSHPDGDPFLFLLSNPYPAAVNLDTDVQIIDLNHLVEDWDGSGRRATGGRTYYVAWCASYRINIQFIISPSVSRNFAVAAVNAATR